MIDITTRIHNSFGLNQVHWINIFGCHIRKILSKGFQKLYWVEYKLHSLKLAFYIWKIRYYLPILQLQYMIDLESLGALIELSYALQWGSYHGPYLLFIGMMLSAFKTEAKTPLMETRCIWLAVFYIIKYFNNLYMVFHLVEKSI